MASNSELLLPLLGLNPALGLNDGATTPRSICLSFTESRLPNSARPSGAGPVVTPPPHASPVPMTLRCTCDELDVSFRCEEPSLGCGGERRGIVPWQPSSAPEEAGRGGLKGRRNRKPLFLRRDWALRLRKAGSGVRRDPRRATEALRLLSGRLAARAAVAVVSVLRWLCARPGLQIRVAPPLLPAVSGCSSASFFRTGGPLSPSPLGADFQSRA